MGKALFFLLVFLLTMFIFPALSLAKSQAECLANERYVVDIDTCVPQDPGGFVKTIYSIGVGLIGGVAVLFIMYGGYLVSTSQGNPSQLNKGRSYITYAIIGLVLAVFGFVFLQFVVNDIFHAEQFVGQ